MNITLQNNEYRALMVALASPVETMKLTNCDGTINSQKGKWENTVCRITHTEENENTGIIFSFKEEENE